ncbi:uncharacterized protein [Diabrotica undecimpunctata]|uniref:uncharacterized protein n=1 Tax=Diabrotica undecimpunctata TaxID=50387 RepID=UPI003B640BF7
MSEVLCDKKIGEGLKGNIYKSVVRTAFVYGGEGWPVKKIQEKKMGVAEMKMLWWKLVKTRRDRIRNDLIRERAGVTIVSNKIQEKSLQWFGHVRHRNENYVGRRIELLKVDGRRGRGQPKRRWKDCGAEDLRKKGLGEEDPMDRNDWRRKVRNIDG